MSIISNEEIDEIIKDFISIDRNNFDKLIKTEEQLNKIISNSPQQLPIVLFIQKEIKHFRANIDNDHDQKLEMIKNLNSPNLPSFENAEFKTQNCVKAIKEQSEKIYDIFNKMYIDFFYEIATNTKFTNLAPIFKIIKDYSDLSKLVKSKDKVPFLIGAEPQEKSLKNTPKYWPLRIKEALTSTFNFGISDYAKLLEATNYFETNLNLFIFISKLYQASQYLFSLHKTMFYIEVKTYSFQNSKKQNLPKAKTLVLDAYVNRLIHNNQPRTCLSYANSINQNVEFDILTNAICQNTKNTK